MGVNRILLPIKSHFFLYWGFMASAPPFVMVVARQVGVPLHVQGVVSAVVTAAAVLVRPLIAALADIFPAQRKIIFLGLIATMIAAYNPIGFLAPLQPPPHLSGRLIPSSLPAANPKTNNSRSLHLFALQQQQQPPGECVITDARDCFAFCYNHEPCPALTYISSGFRLVLQHSHNGLDAAQLENSKTLDPIVTTEPSKTRGLQGVSEDSNGQKDRRSTLNDAWEKGKEEEEDMNEGELDLTLMYVMEGVDGQPSTEEFNVSIECQVGVYGKAEGDIEACAPAVWGKADFWVYAVFLLVAYIAATTVESASDAICCDIIGESGNYGRQRVWGVLSYGVLGAVSGLLVDWRSGDSAIRDYRPAFYLMTACGTLDLLLSAACLKVPKLEAQQKGVRANLGPLLRQVHFLIFLLTAFLIGLFDGLDTGFLFVLQDDIAKRAGKPGHHVNMVQGLTLLVQALTAIPCMFLCDWFIRKVGALKVISIVVFLYSLRLLGLATASHMGMLWVTVLVEMINGPCFGLGYTAIVVHASALAPRGFSTTVQSVVGVCYGTLGYAGASFVGGVMYTVLGGQWLYLVTGVAAFLTWTLHLSYLMLCQPVTKAMELEQTKMGRHEEARVPQAVAGLDAAPFQTSLNGGGAREETLQQEEEEEETLLEKKSHQSCVTEEEKQGRVEADSPQNSTLREAGEGGACYDYVS